MSRSRRYTKRAPRVSKPTVLLFIKPDDPITTRLMGHIARNMKAIRNVMILKPFYLKKNNLRILRQYKVTGAPMLIYGPNRYIGEKKIVRILTPKTKGYETFMGESNPDDMMEKYHLQILLTGDEEKEGDDVDMKSKEAAYKKRMEAFNRKRTKHLAEITPKKSAPRGRRGRKMMGTSTDDEFLKRAGVDNVATPSMEFEQYGDAILEQYRTEEADKMRMEHGIKTSGRHKWRRPK